MTNPFSTALRAAITTSGHSLKALSLHLSSRGTPAGISTLSSWQTGVNHPERRASLAALAGLEELLDLEPHALRGLLPSRRPRGRWRPPSATTLPHHRMWRSPEAVERVLAKLDAVPEDLYVPSRISRSVKVGLDADGHEREARHRLLLRCETDAAHRIITLLRSDSLPQPPSIADTEGCRLGRMRADVPGLLSAFELILDQPMSRGDLSVVEFSMRYPPGQTEHQYDLRVSPGTRDLVIQMRFAPGRLPKLCRGFYLPAQGRPERVLTESPPRRQPARFQIVVLDPQPGIYGVRWEWP
ncbi:MAG: helix-turn-helix domain-containing protein [Stackebrandtia sp.]